MAVTLLDIAKRAGVSAKTVSGALHGGPVRMADNTRRKITAIAEELGYVTNMAARGMRQGWLPLIGLIGDGTSHPLRATEIMRGLDEAARKAGMAVFALGHREDEPLDILFSDIHQFRPRAICYASSFHNQVTLPANLAARVGVTINCREVAGRVASIVSDEEDAARRIVHHLISAGRRRIAFVNLPGVVAGNLRALGFRKALSDAGIAPLNVLPAVRPRIYRNGALSLVDHHLENLLQSERRPDAILCGSDLVAMEVYAVLARMGIRIPADIAVASFDNRVEVATRLNPPLTTMAPPHRAMGRMSVDVLLDAPQEPHLRKLPFRLIERKSV
jgi:DNA-binding LacI/PurR family transcriptional regulator